MKKISVILQQILQITVFYSFSCQSCEFNEVKVTVECSEVKSVSFDINHKFLTCESTSSDLTVIEFKVEVANVKISNKSMEALSIKNAAKMNFLPTGIKNFFPKLKALEVENCGLIHIDRHDMKELGADLLFISIKKTEVFALGGGLFECNPKLESVIFAENPLSYIDPQLFTNFKKMKSLSHVKFKKCNCMFSNYHVNDIIDLTGRREIASYNWDVHKCNDISTQLRHMDQFNQRETFINKNIFINELKKLKTDVDKVDFKLSEVLQNLF